MGEVRAIDRLPSPVSAETAQAYVAAGKPFICADALGGTSFDAYLEPAAAIRAFASGQAEPRRGSVTVADYFARPLEVVGSISFELPPEQDAALCAELARSVLPIATPRIASWMGRAGALQRFHCDMDACTNFLHQVFGTKRICLVSPDETQKMQPRLDHMLLLSELPFHQWDETERRELLAYANGYDCVLAPGETVFIPTLWWHYVEYLTDSISVTAREPISPLVAELQLGFRAMWRGERALWQGVVHRIASDRDAAAEHGARARAIAQAATAGDPDVAREIRALHAAVCPRRYTRPFRDADLPYFADRSERPLAPKRDAWRADDVPRVRPGTRFATIAGDPTATLVALDGAHVLGELVLDAGLVEALAVILGELLAPGAAPTIAELAVGFDLEVAQIAALLDLVAREDWVGTARCA